MKLLLMLNASLLLCAAVQAKFPADGLIKTAASGAIQGKTVLMKAENAELSKSKLAKIRSVKFIAGNIVSVSYTHLTLPTILLV